MLATNDPCSVPKTIIFFPTKKQAVEGFVFLQKSAAQKHYVGAYHASLTEETKFFVRQNFHQGPLKCDVFVLQWLLGW